MPLHLFHMNFFVELQRQKYTQRKKQTNERYKYTIRNNQKCLVYAELPILIVFDSNVCTVHARQLNTPMGLGTFNQCHRM